MLFSHKIWKIWKRDYEKGKFKSKISLSGPSSGGSTKERVIWMLNIWKVIPLNHPGIFFRKAPFQTPQFARSCRGESDLGRSVQTAWRHRAQGGFWRLGWAGLWGLQRVHWRWLRAALQSERWGWKIVGVEAVSLNQVGARGKHRNQRNCMWQRM